jgi:crossover junction endodeoxyribonuclease RuvC
MIVMGLDLATATAGVACVEIDTGNLTFFKEINAKKSWLTPKRCAYISSEISNIIDELQPDYVWGEAIGTRFIQTAIGMGRVHQSIYEALEKTNRSYETLSPSQVKKYATGSGTAKKEQMIKAAYDRWNVVLTDNEADAAWVAEYGRNQILETKA